MERTLRTQELATLWRVSTEHISTWRALGFVTIGSQEKPGVARPYTYTHAEIDALHRERAAIPGQPLPTVAELLALSEQTGMPSLLQAEEVAARVGRHITTIDWHIRNGHLPAFKVGQHWLIPLPGVAALVAMMSPEGTIVVDMAARLLGASPNYVRQLSKGDDALLKRAHVISESHEIHMTETSFMDYLAAHVHNCTPAAWREMRVLYNYEPLLTKESSRRQYRIDWRDIQAEIDEGRWPVLQTHGGGKRKQWRIPQHLLDELLRLRRAMPAAMVAQLLGATEEEAIAWMGQKDFCIRRHRGPLLRHETCPSPACMEQYVADHQVGAAINYADWSARCLQDHMPLVRSSALYDLAQHLDSDTLRAAFDDQTISGIALPDGDVIMERAAAMALNRRIERLLGRDYRRSYDI